jgi:hypothetical protein
MPANGAALCADPLAGTTLETHQRCILMIFLMKNFSIEVD